MNGILDFFVTPAERDAIGRQLNVFRSSNDRDASGNERTDSARTIDAVGVILGDDVADELRAHLVEGNVIRFVERLPAPFLRFHSVVA